LSGNDPVPAYGQGPAAEFKSETPGSYCAGDGPRRRDFQGQPNFLLARGAEVARAGVNAQAAADQISENNGMATAARGISA
jgi:hypothetical protein